MAANPRANSLKIDVEGLRDFQKELRAIDSKLPRQLRVVNKKIADMIAGETKSSMSGRSDVAHETADAVTAKAEQRNASILLDGTKAPMIFGVEFGGGLHGAGNPTPGGGHTTQFQPWRGNGPDAGYSLYPVIRKNRQKIVNLYGDLIDDVVKDAFPN